MQKGSDDLEASSSMEKMIGKGYKVGVGSGDGTADMPTLEAVCELLKVYFSDSYDPTYEQGAGERLCHVITVDYLG
jgi:hypothetical protein